MALLKEDQFVVCPLKEWVKSWRHELLEMRKQRDRETGLLDRPRVEVNQDESACSRERLIQFCGAAFIMLVSIIPSFYNGRKLCNKYWSTFYPI